MPCISFGESDQGTCRCTRSDNSWMAPVSFDMTGPSVPGGELFNEMGREMFAEHNRRQDLIRWGLCDDNAEMDTSLL